jgi:hypothetical protein
VSYCDTCGYPAPCGREHYWLEQEQRWEAAVVAQSYYCRTCKKRMRESKGFSVRFCARCKERADANDPV